MSTDLWKLGVVWRDVRPDGAIRHSQISSTYGPGSLVDLVDGAVIVSGLSWWSKGEPVVEDRLLAMLAKEPDFRNLQLFGPPPSGRVLDDPTRKWIKVFKFPQWFTCQNEKCWEESGAPDRRDGAKPRRLLRINSLDGAGHRCKGSKGKTSKVQPVRFTRACRFGHIDDIAWFDLVHTKKDGEQCRRQTLWIDEAGASGDLADVRVACSGCGQSTRMSVAAQRFTQDKGPTLGSCEGKRPWLGEDKQEGCGEPMRFLLRSATHAYFPLMASVIHIPDPDADLRDKITAVLPLIKNVKSAAQIDMLRELQDEVRVKLEGVKSDVAYAEVVRRRENKPAPQKKPKEAEVEVLLASSEAKNNDRFTLKGVSLPKGRTGPISLVNRLVLLPRLTEVRALVGFTRFDPKGADIDGDLDIGAEVARIDDPMTWLPAVENSGEGFFFALDEAAITRWETEKEGTKKRADLFREGFKAWQGQREDRKKAKNDFATARYVLLHSLSHLLITAVSLECGYASSSIRERIYAGAGGSGILLYTASPGAEGSLGGLVEVGRRLARYLEHALDLGRLCSNDPVCAAHLPDGEVGSSDRHLEGASCHGCLLISEPSCERMNQYLDRSLVVPTVETSTAAFFSGT
jgi:hypothetical protein